jgi:hypothetical protein
MVQKIALNDLLVGKACFCECRVEATERVRFSGEPLTPRPHRRISNPAQGVSSRP